MGRGRGTQEIMREKRATGGGCDRRKRGWPRDEHKYILI